MGFRIAYAQLSTLVGTAAILIDSDTKHLSILNIEVSVVTEHMTAALNRDGALHAASAIVIQRLPLLRGEELAIAVILCNSTDTIGKQHRDSAKIISRAIQSSVLRQEHGVITTGDHIHNCLRDIHLHNLIATGSSTVTQPAIPVVAPCPYGAVLLQRIIAATATI